MNAPPSLLVAASAATLVAGLILLTMADEVDLAVAVAGSLSVVLTFARSWTLRTGRAFVHGYHAGYHDATHGEVSQQPCDVIDLASQANDQLRRLPA